MRMPDNQTLTLKLLFIHPPPTMAKALSDLKRMQRNQLTRMTKEDLIESILAAPVGNDEQLLEVTNKLHTLVTEFAELRKAVISPDSGINKKINELETQVNKQAEIISKQQQYFEYIDRKERENNIIITGVPDENMTIDGAASEEDKLNKIWSSVGANEVVQSHRRLGATGRDNRCRPILLTVNNKEAMDSILEKAKQLKQAGREYEKIFIKNHIYSSIRKEWKRLHDAERAEKGRPENVGCVIRLDKKERKLYRDGVVIDSWNQLSF